MTQGPCCGAPMEADSATALARAARMRGEVTPQQLALVKALVAAGALRSESVKGGGRSADRKSVMRNNRVAQDQRPAYDREV